MTDRTLARIQECLWSRTTTADVWMILDGARDPSIYPTVRDWPLENTCLYPGVLPIQLRVAAPCLIRLNPKDRATERLIRRAWGRSWGVFLNSDTKLPDLRNHLQTFLKVRDPRGARLLFRYYDPRVLRVYLPTSNTQELHGIFGPVHTFWTEAESPDTLLEFTASETGLRTLTYNLEQTAPVSLPNHEQVRRHRQNPAALTIRNEQMDMFRRQELHKFEEWLTGHLSRFFPQQFRAIGESQARSLIRYGIWRAASHDITSKREVCKYIDLMMVLGRDFDTNTSFDWALPILKRPDPPDARIAALYEAAQSYLMHRGKRVMSS